MNNPPRILIVDDEPLNIDYLEQELEDKGFELLSATNGQEALDTIRASLPDLVLLDIMMPVMDGFAALEQVKADAVTRNIPIIIISANNDLKSVVRGIQRGAEDYLPKPFEPVILNARISASLDRKRLRDQEQIYLQSLENELNIARDIQTQFLPPEMPELPGWQLAPYFKAAKFVAGDYYDAFTLPGGELIFVVGDVCGKGVGAALFMTLFRSLIRATASASLPLEGDASNLSPAARLHRVVSVTNRYVAETHEQALVFSTLVIGLIDGPTGAVTYINAGNEAPCILRKNGAIEELRPTGPVIGFNPSAVFKTRETRLEPGESLLVFTDGIPDAKDPQNEFFGIARVRDILNEKPESPAQLAARIGAELDAFIGEADQFDDITILALRRMG
ncbi:MAG: SpoIIE family protein phosphatase [Anaerolineales bacterium]|jgi:serine phosphatase RsbU (regulator of sigma subunit)|nr:SpoIIE family protein phosphatase [Chloroflexota bacterium]MBK6647918.1 SpoIIE family protein phosphatase [Anaerolineales bacterium]MCC6984991.1 SpoIIE family protein phosphatase [Anaerolineales bacterium]